MSGERHTEQSPRSKAASLEALATGDLEALVKFPLDFPIKVIGRDAPGLTDTVLDILDEHFDEVRRDSMNLRPSRGGKYLAVTTTVRAESRAQLDAAYRALTGREEVLWAL